MARTRNLEVVISGDTKDLSRAFKRIEKDAGTAESRIGSFGKSSARAFGLVGAAAAGVAVVGLKKSVDAAIEAEKAQARMQAQLKASGISYRAHAKEIDNVIQRTSKLAGLDDEDLQDAFTNIVRSTGSVDKGLRNIGLAADIARAKHIDVAKAGQLLGRVATGNVTALSRYGIQIDKNATSSEALAELQRRFAGQAEAYGKTTAGSMERAGVAAENLGEAVGAKLAPFVAKAADALTNLIDESGQASGPIRTITGTISRAYNTVRDAVTRFARTNREEIRSVVQAVRNLGRFFRNVFEDIILPAVRAALPGIRQALGGIVQILRGIIRIITGIINGDWSRVWSGMKDIVKGEVRALGGIVKAEASAIGSVLVNAGKGLGKAIVRGIVSAFSGIGGAIKDKLSGAVGALNPFGDGLGKQIGEGLGNIPSLAPLPTPAGRGASGSLQGADAGLAPFARIGAGFGLHVSPGGGRRPAGTRTSSNGISWHSTGEAIDLANGRGPDQQKLSFFRTMKNRFGSRLAELIYTPGGVGVKDGRPFTYTGAVAADHFDHVHVAMDLGRPGLGIGDGPGRRSGLKGIDLAVDAARSVGLSGTDLVNMVAIAARESSYDPTAHNLNPATRDDSWGLWQINVRPEANPKYKNWNLTDPYVNAKAMAELHRAGGYRPWHGFVGVTPQMFQNARAAVLRSRGRKVRGSAGATAGGGAGGGGSSAAADTTSPYDLAIAGSDVEIAEAQQVKPGGFGRGPAMAETGAQRNRLSIVNRRIRQVRKALKKKGLRPATKLRLRTELASLLGERSTIQGRLDELATLPESTDSGAGTTVETSGDTEGGAGGQDNQAQIDALNAVAAAMQAAADAQREHNALIADNTAELKRQTDFATAATSSSNFQAWKALADIMSGQLGPRVAARNYTPGVGVAHAY